MIIITDTQRKIIDAFFLAAKEHPRRKEMTMQLIADRAGMNKATIYKYHFSSVDEIIEKIHFLVDKDIGNAFENFITSDRSDFTSFMTDNMLPHLYDNKDWLKILYGTNIDPDWLDFLVNKYSPMVEKYLNKIEKNEVIPNFYLSQVVVKEFISIISVWLTDDTPEPVSLFKRKFLGILQLSLTNILMPDVLQ